MLNRNSYIFTLAMMMFFSSCSEDKHLSSNSKSTFTLIPDNVSNVNFSNDLDEKNLKSVFNYINAYTGAGVAIGDINNDGLQDVFFAGNMVSSKLYINKGDFNFEDITATSGTTTDKWCTAVTMGDVNNDGWLDIYVCRAYHDQLNDRRNLLFINNKDNTFTESGQQYGVDDANFSIASAFLDYDLDGDLDLYVGNHPRYRALPLATHYNYWLNPVNEFSNHLYRNDGGKFTKVTQEAGLMSYGFTLGVSTSDYNLDGYPDIYVTVDHDEPDAFFRNNGDGTFTNVINSALEQTSLSSMGIDAGDINHDKFPDYIVAEMLTEDHYREKVNMSMSNVKRFEYFVDSLKYMYYQMHNYLHLNNGNGTLSDVSQLAGIHKSDWSWSTLFLDFDHDGWQDIFISNGLYKEVYHRDRKGKLDSVMVAMGGDMKKMNEIAQDYSLNAQQTKIQNYLYKGGADLKFKKYIKEANLVDKAISTGAAYGDLDNDGDLDLVVNNIGDKAFVYRNNQNDQKFLRVQFEHGPIASLGSKVYLYTDGQVQSREMLMTRGFLSSSEPFVHFGVGDVPTIEKVEVVWPNKKMEVFENVKPGTILKVSSTNAKLDWEQPKSAGFVNDLDVNDLGLDYKQNENYYFDYDDQVLLPHRMSEYGPFIEVGDLNKDGMDDVVVGSPASQATAVYLQLKNGKFRQVNVKAFQQDAKFEDGQLALFDANGDGHLDICVGSTGYQFDEGSDMYKPRLYLGDGKGGFTKKDDAFGEFTQSVSCVEYNDFDGDGDFDLFLGGRDRPKKYPKPGLTTIWRNDGQGNFTNDTPEIASDLQEIGMVRDALWTDLNADGNSDLIVVGEWMPITFFVQKDGKFENKSSDFISDNLYGWWNTVEKGDLNGDGKDDLVLGNLGYNYKYHASKDKPFIVYTKDFDESGSQDIVLGTYYGDVMYPVRGKNCSSEQIPDLEKKFPTFEEYANADIVDVYGDALKEAAKYEVNEFGSVILIQNAEGKFTAQKMPNQAQRSPINAIHLQDVDGDQLTDIIAVGNLYQSEIETGRADAGKGVILINQGGSQFKFMPNFDSGMFVGGDVKSMKPIRIGNKNALIIGKNRDQLQVISF